MTSFLKRRSLSKPAKGEKIPLYDLATVRSRNKNKAHSLLLELFQESEISKAELALMLGKRPEQITRWLGGPGNLTLETISDLIFAMKGEFFSVECKDDLSRGRSNRQVPTWVSNVGEKPKWEQVAVLPKHSSQRQLEKKISNYATNITVKSSSEERSYGRYTAKPTGKENSEVA